MKHLMKYGWTVCCLATVSTLMFTSCEDEVTGGDLTSAIMPESIELSIPEDKAQLIYQNADGVNILPLLAGETVQLGYTISPNDITYNDVIWSSSNVDVATVEDGLVTAVAGDGSTYSVVQVIPEGVFSGSGIFDNVTVMVSNTMIQAETIDIVGDDQIYAGESMQLSTNILPENSTYKTVQWSVDNTNVASIDSDGLLVTQPNETDAFTITVIATAMDGSGITGTKQIVIQPFIEPQEVYIDQTLAASSGYRCAINEASVALEFTTVPAVSTHSVLEWSSSDESIATVENGVVTFNTSGNFGDFTITATCRATGHSSSIQMSMPAGLIRELFDNPNHYTWYNANQSGNGTSSSHTWNEGGYITVHTYTQNATNQRGDLRCWGTPAYLHAGNYPIVAIRMEDVIDKYGNEGVTSRNINLDGSGNCNGTTYSGNCGGNNNKWAHDYKCSDGTHVFIYDLTTQGWNSGGILPNNAVATFTTLQFKYADIRTITHQLDYDVYWIQTFESLEDVGEYIESEGLTYEVVK